MVFEGIHNVEVNGPGSRGGRRARSRLGVAPCTCLGFIGELVRGVVGAGGCFKNPHRLVHHVSGSTEDVESDIRVQAEFCEGMPVSKFEEQISDRLIVAQWEETFESWHNGLRTIHSISIVNATAEAKGAYLKKRFIIPGCQFLPGCDVMPELAYPVTPKRGHPAHAGETLISVLLEIGCRMD